MIPSKKVLTLILVSILIVTGAFVFAEYKNKQTLTGEYTADSTNILTAQNSIDTYKDSDNDGLKDWEEMLWGTDPKIADADKKDTKTTVLNKKTENLTATDKLARTFFSQYMNLKEVGLQNDKDSQERVAKNLLADINFTQTPAPYTEIDIKTSTTLGLREYGNTIGSIFKNNLVPGRNEVAILQNALTLGNREVLKELDPIVAGYRNIRTGLLATTVPSQAISSHVSLLNSLNKIIFLVELLSKTFTDPAVGIQGVALYQPTFVELQQSFEGMRTVFKNAGIAFTSSEPGIFFQPQ